MKSLLVLLATVFVFASAFASETTKGIKKDYESFKQEMSAKLEATEQKIAELKSEAQAKGDKSKEKTIQTLEETRDKLKSELEEAKTASKSTWGRFKKSFAASVDRLNTKVQKAIKE